MNVLRGARGAPTPLTCRTPGRSRASGDRAASPAAASAAPRCGTPAPGSGWARP